jgi:hypothetical protein
MVVKHPSRRRDRGYVLGQAAMSMTTRTDTTSIENSGDDAYASHQHERDLNLRSD